MAFRNYNTSNYYQFYFVLCFWLLICTYYFNENLIKHLSYFKKNDFNNIICLQIFKYSSSACTDTNKSIRVSIRARKIVVKLGSPIRVGRGDTDFINMLKTVYYYNNINGSSNFLSEQTIVVGDKATGAPPVIAHVIKLKRNRRDAIAISPENYDFFFGDGWRGSSRLIIWRHTASNLKINTL